MTAVCLYFQVHQPKRLKKYSYFAIGNDHYYEDDRSNREIFLKVAHKCYLPAGKLFLKLIENYPGVFKFALALSGVFIEQCRQYSPETLAVFKQLVATGQVELLNETYYHSLSFIFSREEFIRQVALHRQLLRDEFAYDATAFRNTELIYNNELAQVVESLGYEAILAEGADKILGWRSPNYLYRPVNCSRLKLLLRNYQLTDDVAFRFSERSWKEFPVYADKYARWLHALHGQADIINLFMDFETFGEHQWEASGIFEFLTHLPDYVLQHPEYSFITPTAASRKFAAVASLDVPEVVSWADVDRDLTAWRGNDLQEDALQSVYALEEDVYRIGNPELIQVWRSLLTSDHFYYMCTKYAADGDVHQYFNPYHNPYEAYINYQNVIGDFAAVLVDQIAVQNQSATPPSKIADNQSGKLLEWWNWVKRKLGGKALRGLS